MIEINLLPQEYRPKAAPKFVMPELPAKKTFLFVAGCIFVVQLLASLFALYEVTELAMVKKRVAELTDQTSLVALKKTQTAAIGERLRKIRTITDRKFEWVSLLGALTNSTTKGVWLSGCSVVDVPVTGGKTTARVLKLDGSVVGQGEETAFTGKFIQQLKADPIFTGLFSGVELSNLVQRKIREFDVYDFSIYCTFKPEKAPAK